MVGHRRALKNKAPFGVATKRFACIGFHPDLDPSGAMKKDKIALGPGQYNPKYGVCTNTTTSLWDRQIRSEEFSKNMGFRNKSILLRRLLQSKHLGPGSHFDELDKDSGEYIKPTFYKEMRFKQLKGSDAKPPPGSYCLTEIKGRNATKVPTLEWDGFVDRFRGPSKGWALAPNRYNTGSRGGIDALLQKVVSKRGPYDLFTGPRDGTTIKNKFSPPLKCAPDKYYTWPSELDYLLHHKGCRRCGRFCKANRFPKKPSVRHMLNDISLCYRDPNSPSPATYHTTTIESTLPPTNMHPFNNAVVECRPGLAWTIMPGPGRYEVQPCKCTPPEGATRPPLETWIFRSKTKRTEYKPVEYNNF